MNTSINCYVFCANITHRLLSYELAENDTTWPLQIMEITLLIAEMKTRNESGCRLYYNCVYPKHQYCLSTIDPTEYREKLYLYFRTHDVQFSCAINQPLLAHHWRVHQCLLTSRFIAPSIPWGVSAPGGKMRKQLLKDHNFLNNSPIFIIESSTFNIFAFQKALHTIHFNLKSCFGFGERYLTP